MSAYLSPKNAMLEKSLQKISRDTLKSMIRVGNNEFEYIGTSYLGKLQKRAVTNLKNYSTKTYEDLRNPKRGQ